MKKFILLTLTVLTVIAQNLIASNSLILTLEEEKQLDKIEEIGSKDLLQALRLVDTYIFQNTTDAPTLFLGKLYHQKGNLNMVQGRYADARNDYYLADQIFLKLKYSAGRTKALINLGTLYQMEKEYLKAENVYKEALKQAYLLSESEYLIPNILLNQANLFDEIGKSQQAIQQFKEVIELCKEDHQLTLKGRALHNLGNQYLKSNSIDSAFHYFNQSYNIKKLTDDHSGQINSLLAFAQIHLKENDFRQAELNYLKAEKIALSLKAYQDLVNVYNNLFQFHRSQKSFDKALEYHIKFKETEDQLKNNSHIKTVDFIEKNHQLALEQQLLKNEKEDQQNILIGVLIFMILFIVISVLLYRMQMLKAINAKQNEEKAKMEKELMETVQLRIEEHNQALQSDVAFKDKELTTNVMHLMQKNELINNVSEQLMQLDDPQMNADSRKKIRSIVYNLQTSGSDEIWKELEVRFEQVHHHFFDQLQQEFPNLTPNEKKLCAFLKLNLSTKDISNITHQSVKSIQVARYRLRKKLGLINSDIDFQTFLSKFDSGALTVQEVQDMY
ncbi:tetratricopeptide repeat protein [Flammeovirga pacifica]|uniref:HTH luxR-type domain-containing protein n=1 Tax=Flammeovirga pacifica TaxID=915059 RepID=A0A1S1YU66_FLAPC|nr:tetratricopeptide repeat protein [Flammeovirga pacifica]OHX64569.1 hypothetical protein NH26_23645 [Flammeovirga pacifica]